MWIEIKSACAGVVSPNKMYGVVKSLKVHRNSTSTSTRLTGASIGSVTRRSCVTIPAPSSAAASYRSAGMLCIPAVIIRNANGQVRQMTTSVIVTKLFPPLGQKQLVDQHVVDDTGVALRHEVPGNDRGEDRQGKRYEKDRAHEPSAAEWSLRQDGRYQRQEQ